MLIPVGLLFLFTYLPFFKMIEFSFYDMKYIGERKWVGLQNYIDVFTRKDCFDALKLSLYHMTGSVIQLALAILFAVLLTRNITFPSIRTIIILNLILAVSGSLSAFEMPYVITGGGFGTSTYFVLMDHLAHTNQKVGLASAMSVVLLTLILLVTGIQKLVEKKLDER